MKICITQAWQYITYYYSDFAYFSLPGSYDLVTYNKILEKSKGMTWYINEKIE